MKNSYHYLLFDLDGTLTESAPGILNSVRYTLAHYQIPEESVLPLERFIGPPLMESFMNFLGLPEEEAKRAVYIYREYFAEKGIFENAPYEGIPEVLQRLVSAGLTLGVATSKPEHFARRILEHYDLEQYFQVICGALDEGPNGTKPAVMRRAIREMEEKFGASKDKMIMIGDREHDIFGAKETGIASMGVLYGYGDREELEKAGADLICETVWDMCGNLLGDSLVNSIRP